MIDCEVDDEPLVETERKCTIDIFNRILDKVIESMEKRFSNNNKLKLDLPLLYPTNYNSFKCLLSNDSLTKLTAKI